MAAASNEGAGRTGPGEAELARLWSDVAEAVVIAEPAGTIVFWNDAAERLFGWPGAEARGQTLDLIIPARLRSRHWAGYERVMETGETSYGDRLLEVPAIHRDGRTLSVAFTVTLIVGPGHGVDFIVAVLRDETERWNERRDLLARLRGQDTSEA
ncbi:MAG TPA: PAS domain-containing protein [Acidimicrobiales bacterium]|nr:PAS domain-containing protein [Acidimicrobiales bacterium]